MRLFRVFVFAFWSVTTTSGLAGADQAVSGDRVQVGGGRVVTLEEVIESVERHHPLIEMARQGVQAAQGEQLEARGAFDTVLHGNHSGAAVGPYPWQRTSLMVEQPTTLWGTRFHGGWRRGVGLPPYYGEYATSPAGEVHVGVMVPLWLDGPIDPARARMQGAAHMIEAQKGALRAQQLVFARDAARAHWEWVAAGLRYRIASGLLDLALARDVQVRRQVEAGSIAAIEILENQRSILLRQRTLVAAERAIEQSAIALSLYYRAPDGTPYVPPPSRIPLAIDALTLDIDEEASLRRAESARPELERYEALQRRARVDLELAESRFAPRLDAGALAAVDLGDGTDPRLAGRGPARIEAGLTLSMPLPFRQARGGIERSNAQLRALTSEATWVRDRIAAEVRDAASAVRAARQAVTIAREGAEVAESVAAAERRRFSLGETDLFVVNLREQAAAEAEAARVDAEAQLKIAEAALLVATGEMPSGVSLP